jgi:hypothetical protein
MLAFRKAGAPASADAGGAELKVAVPPGGTVDVGTVQLARPPAGAAQPVPTHGEPFP